VDGGNLRGEERNEEMLRDRGEGGRSAVEHVSEKGKRAYTQEKEEKTDLPLAIKAKKRRE